MCFTPGMSRSLSHDLSTALGALDADTRFSAVWVTITIWAALLGGFLGGTAAWLLQ